VTGSEGRRYGVSTGGAVRIETTGDVIRIPVDLPVPPGQAWALLTEKPHIVNWWGDHVDLQARSGGGLLETWFDSGREVITSGRVTRCDPPFVLEMTWADDDWPGETRVAFHLSGNGSGTRLVLDHSGWSVHPPNKWGRLIQDHARGWSEHLVRLAGYAVEVGSQRRESAVKED
jgi:uncharacterized protein YndB with AHSA1/START domain